MKIANLLIDTCVFIDAFDSTSANHPSAFELIHTLKNMGVFFRIPAHGWFEIECTFKRLRDENRIQGSNFAGQFPINIMYIDKEFIDKYALMDIPYTKAGDHIFIAVAKKNNWPLVTSDRKMYSIASEIGIEVYNPEEFIEKHKVIT